MNIRTSVSQHLAPRLRAAAGPIAVGAESATTTNLMVWEFGQADAWVVASPLGSSLTGMDNSEIGSGVWRDGVSDASAN